MVGYCEQCGCALSAWFYYTNSSGNFCSSYCAEKHEDEKREMKK